MVPGSGKQLPQEVRYLLKLCNGSVFKKVCVTIIAVCFLSLLVYSPDPRSLKIDHQLITAAMNLMGRSSQFVIPKQQEMIDFPNGSQEPLRGPGDSQLSFPKYGKYMNTLYPELFKEPPPGVDPPDPYNPPLKKILFYNTVHGYPHYNFGLGRTPFIKANCPVNTCMTTGDRNRFPPEEIDAVVWQIRSGDRSFPEKRYGVVYRRETPISLPDLNNITALKNKHAVWFVSNCRGSRAQLVAELQKNKINVDIYGACGKLKCNRGGEGFYDVCFKKMERDYKFYLAFENSLCVDYISEKFFNPLNFYLVPVVYGFGNFKRLAPPHSYIDALDFESPEALAEYLHYLDKNDTAYMEYFLWKAYHHPPVREPNDLTPYCEICARLHNDNETKIVDLQEWWMDGGRCQ